MKRKVVVWLSLAPLALTACDGVLRIRGVAPEKTSCIIKVIDEETGRTANSFTVSGPFEENVFFPGQWRAPDIAVTAECGGKLVSTVLHPDFPEVDLGKIEP
jgi:hypothetical protein